MTSGETSRDPGNARPATTGAALDRRDAAVAMGLAVGYLLLLLGTVRDLGYARDEGFYFHAARVFESWLELFSREGFAAFQRSNVDRYFAVNHEHPMLMKGLFALSHRLLHERFELILEPGTAYRLPGMLMGSLAVAIIYLWGRELAGRFAGLVGALLFALMPRVFYHAHLACFDVPVATLWLATSYLYYRSFHSRSVARALAVGVLYGLLLDTKHNSWLLPFALGAHLFVVRALSHWLGLRRPGPLVPWGLVALLFVGPPLFVALWPWIWFDTLERLAGYARFHLGHEYYNMEFLGRTYWEPPMPRGYAWLMTLATVPAITLSLFALGLFDSLRHACSRPIAALATRAGLLLRFSARAAGRAIDVERLSADALIVLCLLVSYAPWLSSNTPIFGGTKHWITAYPFLCLLAARGVRLVSDGLAALPALQHKMTAVHAGIAAACLLGPLAMTLGSHPYGLTSYTPVVGGAPGAASLGLNRTFWGYTTGALTAELNRRSPGPTQLYLHDTATPSFDMLVRDGRVEPKLRGTLAISASRLALYHHEPHMGRVEYQVWVDYGTRSPVALGLHDGVPVVWLYERPNGVR